MSGNIFQGFNSNTASFYTPWRDIISGTVTVLLFDVHLLRFILTLMEPNCVQRTVRALQQMMTMIVVALQEDNTGFLSPRALTMFFRFLKGRVALSMNELRRIFLEASKTMNKNKQKQMHLLAVLHLWTDYTALCSRNDAFDTDRSTLMAKLRDVVTHLEAVLEEQGDGNVEAFAEKPVVVCFDKVIDEEKRVIDFSLFFNNDCDDGSGIQFGTWPIFVLFKRYVGSYLFFTAQPFLVILYSVMILLILGLLLLDYSTLCDAGVSFSPQTSSVPVVSSSTIWNIIRFCMFAMQLALMMVIGIMFFTARQMRKYDTAKVEDLNTLLGQLALFMEMTGRATHATDVDNVDNDYDNTVDVGGIFASLRDTIGVEIDTQPVVFDYQYDEETTLCGNVNNDKVAENHSPENIPCEVVNMCSFLEIGSDEPVGLQFNSTKTMNNTKKVQGEKCVNDLKEVDINNQVASIYPQCMQAKREIINLITDVPSGVAEKCNDPLLSSHTDSTVKICRHLVENVQDCVCPLVIVECASPTMTQCGSYKITKNKNTFPVVYCNFSALELLQYRWMTEITGEDFRNVFGLYRNLKRSSVKRRTTARKVSTLPALPQQRQRTSHGRFVMVPSPPSKEQRQHKKHRRLEEISDPHWLFENGVEELITVFATRKASYFDVYAMSCVNIVLPSCFCDVEETNTSHSAGKSYLVLLFLRPVSNETNSDGIPSNLINSAIREECVGRKHRSQSPLRRDVHNMLNRGASSASTDIPKSLVFQASVGKKEVKTDFTSGSTTLGAHRPGAKTEPSTYRRTGRRSTTKSFCALVSAERGHTVDQVTARQLHEKLDGLKAVLGVEMSPRVPEKFLINFVALMIFVNRVLRRYKRVRCYVDAENMYLLLDVKSEESLSVLMNCDRQLDSGASLSSRDVVTSDTRSKTSGKSDACSSSFLSANLMEYLRACDASIMFSAEGCTLRFPYTTQERLALMGDVGSLQLSTARGVSLFGVAAANALTEELARTNGEMIHLDQYASAEKAFSEAMIKANSVSSPLVDCKKCLSSPSNSESILKPNLNTTMSFLNVSKVRSTEEQTAMSFTETACCLPSVIDGTLPRGLEIASGTTGTVAVQEFKNNLDANPMSLEWPSTSLAVRVENIFARPHVRSGSDAMATSITSNGLSGVNGTGRSKRFLHVFLYMREYRQDVQQYLWSIGHSATVVSEPAVMKRYLLIGMHIFDVVFIEWTEKLVTPDIRDLIANDAGKQSTILYLLNEDAYTFPLPSGTPNEAVLRMHDMAEIFTNPTIGHYVSLYIQQRRLRHEMIQIRWCKDYQIVRRLGGGAFGDVYEVYLFVSRGRLAMKRLFLGGANSRVLEQLNREVLIMSQLDHPNVVSFSHSSMEDHAYCIFMELCDGTLSQRLQHACGGCQGNRNKQQEQKGGTGEDLPLARLSIAANFPVSPLTKSCSQKDLDFTNTNKTVEPLTPREVVLFLHDIASGIAYIHSQGIVHRDIKPCNILFSNGVAKIADFGTAAEENTDKPLINMKGTLAYMAPEVLLGEPYGKPCDMWSFGCLVAETIGLRLGHLQGLHVPALIELYKSIPSTGSLPITVANYKGGTFQHHYGERMAQMILGVMKKACHDSCNKEFETTVLSSYGASITWKEKFTNSFHEDLEDTHFQNSLCCDSKRSVAYFSTNSTTFLDSDNVQLPQSLVELLENLFHRDTHKRMTAEEVLHHPVTWNVEWMDMVMRAVEDIYSLETEDTLTEPSPGIEANAGKEENLDLSITSK